MKTRHSFIIVLLFCSTIISLSLFGTTSSLINLGFERGSFYGWIGYTWRDYNADSNETKTTASQDVIYTLNGDSTGNATVNSTDYHRRQCIISDTTAYDIYTGNKLRKVPSGYKYSARLGDGMMSSDSNPRGWEQSLRYNLKVDSTNSLLILKFAPVLEYASHSETATPRFKLTLYDSNGTAFSTCTDYDVYSLNSGTSNGFQTSTFSSSGSYTSDSKSIIWRDWTTVGADLSAYKGKEIIIEFMSADCKDKHHFGYAYFVADCQSMSISTNFCGSSDTAKLKAPDGFISYKWYEMGSSSLFNNDTTLSTISVPMINRDSVVFECVMRSATGCVTPLTTTILKYKPVASFSSQTGVTCYGDSVLFTNKSTTNRGTLSYIWDYGDGSTYTTTDNSPHWHHYDSPGHHSVSLTVNNPPSTCSIDTIKDVESINVDKVNLISAKDSVCSEKPNGKLVASGAWSYLWSADSTATQPYDTTSIKTGMAAGTYWVIGYNSTYNCISHKHYTTIQNENDWLSTANGKNWFCTNDSTQLTASGWYADKSGNAGNTKNSLSYLWNDGSTGDTIVIGKAGTYYVTITDIFGCVRKSKSITVSEKALPLTEFSVSPSVINPKHNDVTCKIDQQSDVTYSWNFGDNTASVSGNPVTHFYDKELPTASYTIMLKDSDTVYGCTNSASKSILMEPFIPNVFTPNGDGHNEYFMPYYDMNIYDRYGILLYTGTKASNGWDGTYKGRRVDPDTYFYVIHYTDYNQQAQTKKGYITLIR